MKPPGVLGLVVAVLAGCHGAPRRDAHPSGTDAELGETTPAGACVASLDVCPDHGCDAAGTARGLFNQLKRRTTTADGSAISFRSAAPITFETLLALQTAAAAPSSVGQRTIPDAAMRRRLASFSVGGATWGEGSPARLRGFLSPHQGGATGTHEGAVEPVNCKLEPEPTRDIHIPITPNAGDVECSGVVVEMIPQGRDARPGWTKENLRSIQKKGAPVLIVGPLFYDSEHEANPDCAHPIGGQPKRMSLWEIHPVVELYVCKAGTRCDGATEGDWIPVL